MQSVKVGIGAIPSPTGVGWQAVFSERIRTVLCNSVLLLEQMALLFVKIQISHSYDRIKKSLTEFTILSKGHIYYEMLNTSQHILLPE